MEAPLYSWSRQRLVLAVLDVHDEPMVPEEVIAFVSTRASYHGLTADPAKFKRPGSAVEVRSDGRWAIAPGTDALTAARTAVRERLPMVRHWASYRRPRPGGVPEKMKRRGNEAVTGDALLRSMPDAH
jgi:hypothetical protein